PLGLATLEEGRSARGSVAMEREDVIPWAEDSVREIQTKLLHQLRSDCLPLAGLDDPAVAGRGNDRGEGNHNGAEDQPKTQLNPLQHGLRMPITLGESPANAGA